jgi:undecaprenyl diphosphate synthase
MTITLLPRHIAIVMDGNGRWAKNKGRPRIAGHRRGVESVRNIVDFCGQRGIEYLTLFAFSSENWRRPRSEVDFLMELLVSTLENEVQKLHANGVQLKIIGDLDSFGARIQKLVAHAQSLTFDNKKLTLTVAINYGGRWDVAEAARALAAKIASGDLLVADITEQLVAEAMSTAGIPDPDLFIRTGGETRISNFLLWQLAYTELYFTDVLWPDFDEIQLDLALSSFAGRQRRFGRTGEQIL